MGNHPNVVMCVTFIMKRCDTLERFENKKYKFIDDGI
jgi:hypothetical protein